MSVQRLNALRKRALMTSRSFKSLFHPGVDATIAVRRGAIALALWFLARPLKLRGWYYRVVFTVDGVQRRRAGEHVLADLRDFTFAKASAFDPDPLVMARRQGRRDVWLRIANYLNLDETEVQLLMENDDGY